MIGVGAGLTPVAAGRRSVQLPAGFSWSESLPRPAVVVQAGRYSWPVDPRSLVDSAIWSGAAIHVDGEVGIDTRSGLGARDGDFSNAKRSIQAAFAAGNATGAAYRVIVKPGRFVESAFTRNGAQEPNQPVAILGWRGRVAYRTGPFRHTWAEAAGTWRAACSGVKRVLDHGRRTPEGLPVELEKVADRPACAAAAGSWCDASGVVHVNPGRAPGAEEIALLRGFHGARFLSHAADLYLENIDIEGGITGALHCDAEARRSIVGVRCTFRHSTPTRADRGEAAVRIRRTAGLVAFFGCDASGGASDGWSFHDDGVPGMHVLLQDCTGFGNGHGPSTSCNGLTLHDAVRGVALSSEFGLSRNGTEVHIIQDSRLWMAGCHAVARDVDGTSVAYKCSTGAEMWLEACSGDATGPGVAHAVEANGGRIHLRRFRAVAGETVASGEGFVGSF